MRFTKTNAILAAVILVALLVGVSLRLAQPQTEIVVINGSRQRIANTTISVPGSDVVFRDLSPGDFVTARVRHVAPPSGWSPSQHGRLADGVEIKQRLARRRW